MAKKLVNQAPNKPEWVDSVTKEGFKGVVPRDLSLGDQFEEFIDGKKVVNTVESIEVLEDGMKIVRVSGVKV